MPPSDQTPAQPPYQPAPIPSAPTPMGQSPEDPGKTLGIVGLVLAFLFSPAGLVLSIIAKSKSKSTGHDNVIALIGIIISIIGMVILLPFVLISFVAFNGVQERSKTTSGKTNANIVTSRAEEFAAENGTYPTSLSQLDLDPSGRGDIIQSKTPLTSAPEESLTIVFYACDDGNKVGYWDYKDQTVVYVYAGKSSDESNCTLSDS